MGGILGAHSAIIAARLGGYVGYGPKWRLSAEKQKATVDFYWSGKKQAAPSTGHLHVSLQHPPLSDQGDLP